MWYILRVKAVKKTCAVGKLHREESVGEKIL